MKEIVYLCYAIMHFQPTLLFFARCNIIRVYNDEIGYAKLGYQRDHSTLHSGI